MEGRSRVVMEVGWRDEVGRMEGLLVVVMGVVHGWMVGQSAGVIQGGGCRGWAGLLVAAGKVKEVRILVGV